MRGVGFMRPIVIQRVHPVLRAGPYQRHQPREPPMFHRLIGLSAFTLAAMALPVHAQLRVEPALNAPRLVIAAPAEAPVTLRAVRVQTEINGRSALTSIEMTFHNP